MFGKELAYTRSNPITKLVYRLLGDLNMGGRSRGWYLLDEMKGLDLNYMRILDAGAGYGPYAFHLARKFPKAEIIAVEIDEEKVRICQEIAEKERIGNVRFIRMDLREMPFENEFEIAICSDVLEHIPDDKGAAERIFAALKPGGLLFLHAPGLYSRKPVWERGIIGKIHKRWFLWHTRGKPKYYFDARAGYTDEEILSLLRSVGFRILKVRPTYGRIGLAAFSLFKIARIFLPIYPLLLPLIAFMCYWEVIRPPRKGVSRVIIASKLFPSFFEH